MFSVREKNMSLFTKTLCLHVSFFKETTSSFDVTPIRGKRKNRQQLLSSEGEDPSSSDVDSPVLTAKKKHTRQNVESFHDETNHFSPFPSHSQRKHSTPKIDLFGETKHEEQRLSVKLHSKVT